MLTCMTDVVIILWACLLLGGSHFSQGRLQPRHLLFAWEGWSNPMDYAGVSAAVGRPCHCHPTAQWRLDGSLACVLLCVPGAGGDFVYGPDGVLRRPRHAAGSHPTSISPPYRDATALVFSSVCQPCPLYISSLKLLAASVACPRSQTCWAWRVRGGCRCSSSRGTGTPSWGPWAS